MVTDKSNKENAITLYIVEGTVQSYVSNLYCKLKDYF
ncbi:LuxR C-terminal-related transcriptional regulator [Lysinibacillus macroides]|nr:hypothetical protein [Lysinibacillus macroides]